MAVYCEEEVILRLATNKMTKSVFTFVNEEADIQNKEERGPMKSEVERHLQRQGGKVRLDDRSFTLSTIVHQRG